MTRDCRKPRRFFNNLLGGLIILASAALVFVALFFGGLTWPVFLTVCVMAMVGGHLISHSWIREVIESVVLLVKAWRGHEKPKL